MLFKWLPRALRDPPEIVRPFGRRRVSMRDRRFVAAHRGGPLALAEHRLLAAWAAECAEHLLPIFERYSADDRPRQAITIGRAWVRGEVKTGVAQRAAVAAHAAAREERKRVG